MPEDLLHAKPPWRSPLWIGTSIALSTGAAIGLVGSFTWPFHPNQTTTDAFKLLVVVSTPGWLMLVAAKLWLKSHTTNEDVKTSRRSTYSFPRRFGLGTLLVLTFAFGTLTAFCRWQQWPEEVVLGVLLFFGLVSAAQFTFVRAPREASVLTGSIVLAGGLLAWRAMNNPRLPWFMRLDISFFTAFGALAGGFVGYCTGTLVGGVFLLMARARGVFHKQNRRTHQA
jgi:hypothetical protein